MLKNTKQKRAKNSNLTHKILLALDPFEPSSLPSRHSVKELKRWAKSSGAKIHSVYVAPRNLEQTSTGTWAPHASIAEKKIKNYLSSVRIDTQENTVLSTDLADSSIIADTVHFLLSYAKKNSCTMIALATHGRSGISRLMSGSFAESLLAESHLPVLVLPPSKHRGTESFSRVLFPTDFTMNSRRAFFAFLSAVQPLKPHVVLYHALILPIDTAIGEMHYSAESQWLEHRNWVRKESVDWMNMAKASGLPLKIILEENVVNLPAAIRKVAKREKTGLVGITESRGLFLASMFGSNARDTFRGGERSVLVYGPNALRDVPMRLVRTKKASVKKPTGKRKVA